MKRKVKHFVAIRLYLKSSQHQVYSAGRIHVLLDPNRHNVEENVGVRIVSQLNSKISPLIVNVPRKQIVTILSENRTDFRIQSEASDVINKIVFHLTQS